MNINRCSIILGLVFICGCFSMGLANAASSFSPLPIIQTSPASTYTPIETIALNSNPTSPTETKSDSTSVQAPKYHQPYAAQVTSTPPSVTNAQYSSLPACPATPSNCPDINGKGGDASTCPDACTVTRNPQTLTPLPGTNRITVTVKEAVCPAGYSQVASYNVQNEATYQTNPPVVKPISGMSKYWSYVNAGYYCSTYGGQQESQEYCNGAYTDGQVTDSVNNAGGYVVRVLNSYRSSCYCSAFDCGATCACWVAGTNPRWTYRYYYMQCQPPAGLYLTGNTIPVSIVCVRPKTTWQQVR